MLQQTSVEDQILAVVRAYPDSTLEEVTQQLPEMHWSEVFLAVHHLRRLGRLWLTQSSGGLITTLHLPDSRNEPFVEAPSQPAPQGTGPVEG